MIRAAAIICNIALLLVSIAYRQEISRSLDNFYEWINIAYGVVAFLNLLYYWDNEKHSEFLKPFRLYQTSKLANILCVIIYLITIHNVYESHYRDWDYISGLWGIHLSGITAIVSIFDRLSFSGKKIEFKPEQSEKSTHLIAGVNEKVKPNKNEKGSSIENPIVLTSRSFLNMGDGVDEIYQTLNKMYGNRGKDWELIEAKSIRENERMYSEMCIKLTSGVKLSVFFDKTNMGNDVEQLLKAQTYFDSAEKKIEKENYSGALQDLNHAIEINSGFAEYHFKRGFIMIQLERPKEAIEDFDKAINLNHEDADFFFSRGVAKLMAKDEKESRLDFERASKLGHKDASAML